MKNSKLRIASIEKYSEMAEKNEAYGFEGIQDANNDLYMANGGASRRSTEPYKLQVANGGLAPQTAIIFGYNRYFAVANYGSGADISITTGITGVTYAELLAQSSTQPFEVVKMRISSTNIAQLDTPITLTVADGNGQLQQTPIDVTSYLSPNQNQDNIRDIDRDFSVDGSTFLSYVVTNGVTVSFSFYISAKVNTVRPLLGRGAVDEYNSVRVRSFK